MNIKEFITQMDFDEIRQKVERHDDFDFRKTSKSKEGRLEVSLHSMRVSKESAERFWHGNDYIVSFNTNYKGPKYGIGGSGFAFDEFSMFDCWDNFKSWFDKRMQRFEGYEVEEFGQTSLF